MNTSTSFSIHGEHSRTMKIGFYSPYLDTLGGGERYTLTLASHWSKRHNVSVFWSQDDILDKAQKRFNINLSGVKVTRNIFRDTSVFKKLFLTRQYDLIFFLSDGSVPSTLAGHNILHYQVPLSRVEHNPIKLSRYQVVVCNSEFTKRFLDPQLGRRARVIYPPVAPVPASSGKKENLILSVGRFSDFHTVKKQHVLIEAFAKGLRDKRLNGWRLILVGALLSSDQDYFNTLKAMANGMPISLEANISHDGLIDYYQKSKIYWHAAGYGVTDPRWMEHFGISTVEAMSAGTVPVVFAAGGQKEIVEDGRDGYLWRNIDDLLDKTNSIIMDDNGTAVLRKMAIEKGRQFSVSRFYEAYDDILKEISS